MRKKDILNKIKTSALNDMPDVFEKIHINDIDIEEKAESFRPSINLRRAFTYTFASLFILISGFVIYSVGFNHSSADLHPLETETELMGFQTVSAAALLSSYDYIDLEASADDYSLMELSQTTLSIENELDLLTEYINLAETVVANKTNYVYQEIVSDKSDYQYSFEYKGIDLVGNLINYQVYYNLSKNDDNIDVSSGIMVHSNKAYTFNSTTVETETGFIQKYQIYINNNNYVEVTDVSTEKLQKFSYEVYKNNQLHHSSELKLINADDQLVAEIIINQSQNKQLTLEFQRSFSNFETQSFQVKYTYLKNNTSEAGSFDIDLVLDSETSQYAYQFRFSNKEPIIVGRNNKGSQKASESDFEETNNSNNDNQGNDTSGNHGQDDDHGQGNNTKNNLESDNSDYEINI